MRPFAEIEDKVKQFERDHPSELFEKLTTLKAEIVVEKADCVARKLQFGEDDEDYKGMKAKLTEKFWFRHYLETLCRSRTEQNAEEARVKATSARKRSAPEENAETKDAVTEEFPKRIRSEEAMNEDFEQSRSELNQELGPDMDVLRHGMEELEIEAKISSDEAWDST